MSEKINEKYVTEFEQEKDRFTQYIAESLRDNHYIKFIPTILEISSSFVASLIITCPVTHPSRRTTTRSAIWNNSSSL